MDDAVSNGSEPKPVRLIEREPEPKLVFESEPEPKLPALLSEPKPDRLIYYEDLERLKGIKLSEMTIWRMMKAGTFPKNRLVGQRKAWLASELDEWMVNLPTGKGRDPDPGNKGRGKRRASK